METNGLELFWSIDPEIPTVALSIDRRVLINERLQRIGLSNPHPFWGGVSYLDSVPLYQEPASGNYAVVKPGPLIYTFQSRDFMQLIADARIQRIRHADLAELVTWLESHSGQLGECYLFALGSGVLDREGVLRVPCASIDTTTGKLNIAFVRAIELMGKLGGWYRYLVLQLS